MGFDTMGLRWVYVSLSRQVYLIHGFLIDNRMTSVVFINWYEYSKLLFNWSDEIHCEGHEIFLASGL